MPELDWNKSVWASAYDWSGGGDEWSAAWGNTRAMWLTVMYPRLWSFIPCKRILEIGLGMGRWTQFLINFCDRFVGVDLVEKSVVACKQRFLSFQKASFFANDGTTIDCVVDSSVDLVFSFDSLVHAELPVLESYIPQILSKLNAYGVAFIHHSNLHAIAGTLAENRHNRATSVSGEIVAGLVDSNGGKVLVQEIINWGVPEMTDCLTLFCRKENPLVRQASPIFFENPNFMNNAAYSKEVSAKYSVLV
jgi:SAM-dependent methyltransferase